MKKLAIVLLSLYFLNACTYLGATLGEELDSKDSDKYEDSLRYTGAAIDAALVYLLIYDIIHESKQQPTFRAGLEPSACDTEYEQQVCSKKYGCVCKPLAPSLIVNR